MLWRRTIIRAEIRRRRRARTATWDCFEEGMSLNNLKLQLERVEADLYVPGAPSWPRCITANFAGRKTLS